MPTVTEDPEGRDALLALLRAEYLQPRTGMHATSLIYCLTKEFYERRDPVPPTEEELSMWSVGFGLERVVMTRVQAEPMIIDGIHLTPDFFLLGSLADLKSTMLSEGKSLGCEVCGEPYRGHSKGHTYKKQEGKAPFDLPKTWEKQFANYVFANWVKSDGIVFDGTFRAAVMHLQTRTWKVYKLEYSLEEVRDQWTWTLQRANDLENMLATDSPEPFGHVGFDGECAHCRYAFRCDMSSSVRLQGLLLRGIES